jgi:AraC-like DNA-binding protein
MCKERLRVGYDNRLFFCEKGRISIKVGDTDFVLEKNSLLFVPSGVTYVLGVNTDSAGLIGINFDFTYAYAHLTAPISPAVDFGSFDASKRLEKPEFSDLKCFEYPFILHGQSEVGSMIHRIMDEYTTSKIYHAHTESAIMKQLLLLLAREISFGADKAPQKTVNVVIEYIQSHYMYEISNFDIGVALNFHPNYLNRLMLKHTGRSLHRYLLYYRLTQALDRLQTTALSVAEIAEQCGFSDTGHFSKAFKKQFGSSPKSMREKII